MSVDLLIASSSRGQVGGSRDRSPSSRHNLLVQFCAVLQFVNVIATLAIGKNKHDQDDVELLLLLVDLTVNKLEHKIHLDDDTFDDDDDLPDLELKVESKLTKLPRKLNSNKSCSLKFGSFYKLKIFFHELRIQMCEYLN